MPERGPGRPRYIVRWETLETFGIHFSINPEGFKEKLRGWRQDSQNVKDWAYCVTATGCLLFELNARYVHNPALFVSGIGITIAGGLINLTRLIR